MDGLQSTDCEVTPDIIHGYFSTGLVPAINSDYGDIWEETLSAFHPN